MRFKALILLSLSLGFFKAQAQPASGTRQIDSLNLAQITKGAALSGMIAKFDGTNWFAGNPTMQTLQQTTTAGNTTTNDIVMNGGAGAIKTSSGSQSLILAGAWDKTTTTGAVITLNASGVNLGEALIQAANIVGSQIRFQTANQDILNLLHSGAVKFPRLAPGGSVNVPVGLTPDGTLTVLSGGGGTPTWDQTMTAGNTTNTTALFAAAAHIGKSVNNSYLQLSGGTTSGAATVIMQGGTTSGVAGTLLLRAGQVANARIGFFTGAGTLLERMSIYENGDIYLAGGFGLGNMMLTTNNDGKVVWQSIPGGGGSGVTNFSAGNLSPLFTTNVATSTTTPALTFALSNAAANTIFGNLTGGSAAPSYNSLAALTKTDDANVTLTLGGTPATALVKAVSMTLGWVGNLAVSRGGIGVGTLTGIAVGNGTSAFTGITGTANQLLRRNAANNGYEFFDPPYLTANQTITLSGDVAGSGTTAITTTIQPNAVTTGMVANSNITFPKIQNIASGSILGRYGAGSGVVQELTLNPSDFSINPSTGEISSLGGGGGSQTWQQTMDLGNTTTTEVILSGTNNQIRRSNNTGHLPIGGGTNADQSNGATAHLYGNSASSNAGALYLAAGNVGTGSILMATGGGIKFTIAPSGVATVQNLSGTGTRVVTANSSGDLGTGFVLDQGTYTATITGNTNITSASVSNTFTYTRQGNIVTVYGAIAHTPTNNNANSTMYASLPVATTNYASIKGVGTMYGTGQKIYTSSVEGGSSNRAFIGVSPIGDGAGGGYTSGSFTITFQYIVQ